MPEFRESDHPRAANGEFGSGGTSKSAKKLNSTEAYAIGHYVAPSSSSTGFLELNKSLRNYSSLSSDQEKQVSRLDSALKKLPSFEGRSFRGVRLNSNDEIDKFIQSHTPGSIVSDPAYLSTSKNSAVATGPVRMVIEGKSGRDLTGISEDVTEQEVLYPRDIKFMVTRVVKDNQGGTIIGMREVDMAADMAFDATARTYDKDGRMHISRSHISKACVNPYYGREIPNSEALGLNPDQVYYLLRSPEELAKGAPTFARLPILKKHIPVTAEVPRQDLIVGTLGSDVEFLDPYLDADVSIWDAGAIVGIETDKIREFSCAYHYVPIMTTGEYNGEHFDGIMTQIQGNHLALVESGRAGSDVMAADSELERMPMKRTKLGNALIIALTTAFPKVQIAQDSPLEKILAGATRKTFDKTAARPLILAMDAEMESKGKEVDAVMDALVDVDDPEPKKKDNEREEPAADAEPAREDGESDEDYEKRKKKAAKDSKAAKDAESCTKKEMKGAMDELETRLRAGFRDAEEAKREVRPVVGDVIAQDSAAEIYGFALDHLKVERAGVEGVPALRALFRAASKQSAVVAPHIAMDQGAAEKQFPGLARIRVM